MVGPPWWQRLATGTRRWPDRSVRLALQCRMLDLPIITCVTRFNSIQTGLLRVPFTGTPTEQHPDRHSRSFMVSEASQTQRQSIVNSHNNNPHLKLTNHEDYELMWRIPPCPRDDAGFEVPTGPLRARSPTLPDRGVSCGAARHPDR